MKLFILSLFATLVATANSSFTCECTLETDYCSKEGTCTTESGECISIAFNNTMKGIDVPSQMYRGCQNSSSTFDQCNENIMFITAGKDFQLISETKCCHSNRCNKDNLTVPRDDSEVSSWGCPSCFDLDTHHCDATTTKCVKSQRRCVNITGTLTQGDKSRDFVLMGCATTSTASVLRKNATLYFGDISYSIATISIGNSKDGILRAPGSIVFAVFLPSLLGLLLNKFLY